MSDNETKLCPYCGKKILEKAMKCKHCGRWLIEDKKNEDESEPNDDAGLISLFGSCYS